MSQTRGRAGSGAKRGGRPAPHASWPRGLLAGILGALAAAVWLFVADLAAGRPFFTPAALGSALFLGARGPAEIVVAVGPVAGYTLIHLSVFAAVGIGASALLTRARRRPRVLLAGLLLTAVVFALFLGLLAILAQFLLGELAWWSLAGASAAAAGVMALHLGTTHPGTHAAREGDPFERE